MILCKAAWWEWWGWLDGGGWLRGEGTGHLWKNSLKKMGQGLLLASSVRIIALYYIYSDQQPKAKAQLLIFQMNPNITIPLLLLLLATNAFELPQCSSNCSVASCSQCSGADCTSCAPGYSLSLNQCSPNNCTVANCSLCDSQGGCLLCSDPYSTFSSATSQCTRSCTIPNCALCKPSSTKCHECSNGYALYQWNSKCTPSPTPNCLLLYDFAQQEFMCLKCRPGFIPTADQSECIPSACHAFGDCTQCNGSICSQCRAGFEAAPNGMACVALPCSRPNCLYCSQQGACLRCFSNHTLSNGSCLESPCSLPNCQTCKSSSQFCDACASGFLLNVWTNQCEAPHQQLPNCQAFMTTSNESLCVKCGAGFKPESDLSSCEPEQEGEGEEGEEGEGEEGEGDDRLVIGVFTSVGTVFLLVIVIIIYCLYRKREGVNSKIENTMDNFESAVGQKIQEQSDLALDTFKKEDYKPEYKQTTEFNLVLDKEMVRDSAFPNSNNASSNNFEALASQPPSMASSPFRSKEEHQFEFIN